MRLVAFVSTFVLASLCAAPADANRIPRSLVGTWQLGSGAVDYRALSSGAYTAGGNLERLVIRPNGAYEHTMVMRAGAQRIVTHETGRLVVRGNQLTMQALKTEGFTQVGRTRKRLGPRRRSVVNHRWHFTKHRRVTYLVLDGVRRLAKVR